MTKSDLRQLAPGDVVHVRAEVVGLDGDTLVVRIAGPHAAHQLAVRGDDVPHAVPGAKMCALSVAIHDRPRMFA